MRRLDRRLFTLCPAVMAGCAATGQRADAPAQPPATAAEVEGPLETVERISVFRAVRVTDEGRVVLVVSRTGTLSLALAVNEGPRWGERVEAGPGDVVHVTTDAIGTGLHWFEILDVHRDLVVLREHSWWRQAPAPEAPQLLCVRPYGYR